MNVALWLRYLNRWRPLTFQPIISVPSSSTTLWWVWAPNTISPNIHLAKVKFNTSNILCPPRFLRRTSRAWSEPWGPMRAQDSETPCDQIGVPRPWKHLDFLCQTLKSAKSLPEDSFWGEEFEGEWINEGGDSIIAVSIEQQHHFLSVSRKKDNLIPSHLYRDRAMVWIQCFSSLLSPPPLLSTPPPHIILPWQQGLDFSYRFLRRCK